MSDAVIHAEGLHKTYGSTHALDDSRIRDQSTPESAVIIR
mgnify:CR=1 FL=1